MLGHELTIDGVQTAKEYRYLGSIPGCIALGCADLAIVTLDDGRQVITTWGRNIAPEDQQRWFDTTKLQLVWLTSDNGCCEIVIPKKSAEALLTILDLQLSSDCSRTGKQQGNCGQI